MKIKTELDEQASKQHKSKLLNTHIFKCKQSKETEPLDDSIIVFLSFSRARCSRSFFSAFHLFVFSAAQTHTRILPSEHTFTAATFSGRYDFVVLIIDSSSLRYSFNSPRAAAACLLSCLCHRECAFI